MQSLRYVGSILLFLSLAMSGPIGCSPTPKTGGMSLIRIQTPGRQKVGAMSFPAGQMVCYAVNITGSGIPTSSSSTCQPSLGVSVGFVAENTEVSLSVPYGSNRHLELYAYLLPGPSGQCPTLKDAFSPTNISSVYYVGGVASFDVKLEDTPLTITATFPGASNNVAVQNSYPATCVASLPIPGENTFAIGAGGGLSTGLAGAIKMNARIGRIVDAPLRSSSIEMKVK